jgi:hypothetical protein
VRSIISDSTAAGTTVERLGREVREARILLCGRARERELGSRTAEREIGVARCFEMHLLFGQLADDLVELARGDREASRLRDLARMRAADPDLEIGRGELERSVLLSRHLEQRMARIGIVLRFSTIDWMRPRPRWNSPFSIENFIAGVPPTESRARSLLSD